MVHDWTMSLPFTCNASHNTVKEDDDGRKVGGGDTEQTSNELPHLQAYRHVGHEGHRVHTPDNVHDIHHRLLGRWRPGGSKEPSS